MDFSIFINKNFLNKNLNDVMKQYDSNQDEKFSKEEIMLFINDAKSTLTSIGTIFYTKKQMLNSVFKYLDKDKNEQITTTEFDNYLKENFDLEFNSIKNKTIKDVCKEIEIGDARVKQKQKQKKEQT